MSMNWPTERYVRVYVRNTPTWTAAPWQARTFLLHLLRALDRSGQIDMGPLGLEALGSNLCLPPDLVDEPLKFWIRVGTIVLDGQILTMPNFIAAQETAASNAMRQDKYREKQRSSNENKREQTRTNENVTLVTPSLAMPSLAMPSKEIQTSFVKEPAVEPSVKKTKSSRAKTACPELDSPSLDDWCKEHRLPTPAEDPGISAMLDWHLKEGRLSASWKASWSWWKRNAVKWATEREQTAYAKNSGKTASPYTWKQPLTDESGKVPFWREESQRKQAESLSRPGPTPEEYEAQKIAWELEAP